jgi:hypothetical protein
VVRGVGVGAGFLAELMDAEVREVVGPKGRSPKFHDERDILLMIAGARESRPSGRVKAERLPPVEEPNSCLAEPPSIKQLADGLERGPKSRRILVVAARFDDKMRTDDLQ